MSHAERNRCDTIRERWWLLQIEKAKTEKLQAKKKDMLKRELLFK